MTQEIVRRRGKDVHVKFGPAEAAAKAASSTVKNSDEASSVGADRVRPGEYPRLIATVFSDDNWPKVCGSEQGSDDRWMGKERTISKETGTPSSQKSQDFINNPDGTNVGVPPRNPKDHANATEVDEHANSELARLWEALASLDEEAYRKAALR